MNKQIKADIGLLIVALIWGMGFIAVEKLLVGGWNPLLIIGVRFLIASIFLNLIFIKKIKFNKQNLKYGIIIGVFLCLAFVFQTYGQQLSTPSKTAFITATNVVMVPYIYFILFKQKIDKSGIIGAFLTLAGVGILSLNTDFTLSFGDTLLLICALGFALHITFVGKYSKECDPISLTVIQLWTAAILSLILCIFTNNFVIIKDNFIWIVYLGIFSSGVAFLMQNVCQKNTSATKAAIILCLESVFGTIGSVIILNEVVTFKMIFGCIIILSGVLVAELKLFSRK